MAVRLAARLRLAFHRQQLFLVVRAVRVNPYAQQKVVVVVLLAQAVLVGQAVMGIQLLAVVLAAEAVVITVQ